MTDLAARAFMDDETFGDFMHPHRHEFPKDWAASWEKEMQSKLADDTTMNSVCIDDAASPKRIVGLSIVPRLGDGVSEDIATSRRDDREGRRWWLDVLHPLYI